MKPRKKQFLWKFFLATSLLALLPLGVARWRASRPKQPYTFPFPELAALDKVVQARFAVVPDKDFGAGRIGKRHEYFNPATPQEQAAISSLPRDVFFYVAGDNMLLERHPASYPRIVQGPILMSRHVPLKVQHQALKEGLGSSYAVQFKTPRLPDNLVSAEELKRLGKEALPLFETSQGITKQSGEWTIAMTPVRASDQACVNCHWHIGKKWYAERARIYPSIGDTLGVAMYAYRRKGDSPQRRGDAEKQNDGREKTQKAQKD